MTTDLFFDARTTADVSIEEFRAHTQFGDPTRTKLNGVAAAGWTCRAMHPSRATLVSNSTLQVPTVAGPTSGLEVQITTNIPYEFVSPPVDQDVTISGTMTFNLWAFESNMSANAAVNCVVERVDSLGAVVSTIITTTRTTEVAISSPAVNNFTGTPTSTAMSKGDRFRARIFFDDSSSTMGSGFTLSAVVGSPTASVNGDSWIQFSETFGFQITDPTTTTLYLRTTASACDPDADTNLEMWTTIGSVSDFSTTRATVAGPTSPLRFQRSSVDVTWYSRPLQATTLQGPVRVHLRAATDLANRNTALRAQLAVVDDDGSGASTWAEVALPWCAGGGNVGYLTNSHDNFYGYLAGDDMAVTDGQRLRLRIFIDDATADPMISGGVANFLIDDGSESTTAWLKLPVALTEYVPPAFVPQVQIVAPNTAVHRASRW